MLRSLLGFLAIAGLMVSGCVDRPIEKPGLGGEGELPQYFPQSVEKDIDILFVIDNSNSMAEEQVALSKNFPNFIEALKSKKLNDKIPNVHIGVITSDLGAGNYGLPSCEVAGGDGGKLQSQPRIAGCTPPSQPFISYNEGVTNIKSGTKDPIEQVKEAFPCIAEIGTGGCGFEHQIQAAQRALDGCGTDNNNDNLGDCKFNPGFIRKDAFLAVVFITDEDDCSAQKPQLFDSNQSSLSDPLGPLTSFRCFEFGIQCDINDRTKPGPRKNCKPAYDWLYKVDAYVNFFKGLKPPGRVLMFAIAGPTDKVEVGMDAQNPVLRPSCQTSMGRAAPAIRIKTLIDGFGDKGFFNKGTDFSLEQDIDVNICSPDYSPALRLLGRVIVAALGGQCISLPPLTRNGGLVCNKGDTLGTVGGQTVTCQQSCLDKADCIVQEVVNQGTPQEKSTVVQKCEPGKFANPGDKDCGAICPCWRIVPKAGECKPSVNGSPYGLEVLRKGEPPKGAVAVTKCNITTEKWGSDKFASLSQCN